MSTPKVFLDPGHGGADPGATGNDLREKDINLKIALLVGGLLQENYVVDIEFSRLKDEFLTLGQRVDKAKKWETDWYISFHSNGHEEERANGYEDYVHPAASGKSQFLRDKFHAAAADVWLSHGRKNRGKRTANFYVLRETPMPAMLLENGFITNKEDAALLRNDEFIDILCNAIASGIASALNLEPKAPVLSFTEEMNQLLRHLDKLDKEIETLRTEILRLRNQS